jgi:RNA polymerase sigma factor (sigma-70 family)
MDDKLTNWLEQAYLDHRTQLFRCAWLILKDSERAEDAVHTAILKLLSVSIEPQNVKALVLTAVRNAALDEYRRLQRQPKHELVCEDTVQEQALGQPFEEELAKLSPEKREVIELRLRVGLTFAEIAKLLNEAESSVTSRYRRAIEELRKLNGVYDE